MRNSDMTIRCITSIVLARRFLCPALLTGFCLSVVFHSSCGWSQPIPTSIDVHWNEGAADCTHHPQPPLQLYRYDIQTYILRESLCSTFEAPFMYLLKGSTRALLIDSGDVADPKQVPLANTVMETLPGGSSNSLPLLVVHTHRHLDHRAGDAQFAGLSNVSVVGYDLDSVRRFYGFADWPDGVAQIELGNRIVD